MAHLHNDAESRLPECPVHPNDVRMVHLGMDLHLAAQRLRTLHRVLFDDFEHALPAALPASRRAHGPEGASTEHLTDLVVLRHAAPPAGLERQQVARRGPK
eukprot:CAMPEP_0115355968 /NCGR_PEP_ID=MMETSP0270-20121206/99369_1 /TAXON_ID=71861 /ORGANISM="Scrippsiella trochoidea, Strain CCMP3099" /LENGTH=100 /DNA_ID=CAMNT_0002778337 /DNA_START=498 /DNA_END=797 /DNA_ORIENTATION=-